MTDFVDIGLARLYHGDCTKVLPLLLPDSVDMVWTDPPYGNNNHDGDMNSMMNKHREIVSKPIANDSHEETKRVVGVLLAQSKRIVKKDGAILVCCGGGGGGRGHARSAQDQASQFVWLGAAMDSDGLYFDQAVVWDKKNPGIGFKYRRRYEFVMIAHREDGTLAWSDPNLAVDNIIDMMPPRERVHPNEKPVILMEKFINWHTAKGAVVLDPFMGSGSTGVAAVTSGRCFIGIELDEGHFNTACRRIEEAQKQEGFF